jgi:Reverse transcriptase (RNA-dependent DNA polymerase)
VVVRIVLATACSKHWVVHQLDVKSAFLNGYIDEEIYMQLPTQYSRTDGKVCKLKRSIYGLRQAPRNKRLCEDLKGCGLKSPVNAEIVLYGFITGSAVYLIIYIDDILVEISSDQAVLTAKKSLRALYTIKDLSEAEYFLAVNIEREHNCLKLSQ